MITLRPRTDADREFQCALYASTRANELAPVPWTDEQKQLFLRSQFDAQWAHYDLHYSDAEFHVVEQDGTPIGRLIVHWGEKDVRIVDIALVPEATGHGLGTRLLTDVMHKAADAGKSVSIHVEQFNPALRVYQRLGFQHVSDTGVYYLMQWTR